MGKQLKNNELKGIFLSLLIHSSLIGAVFVYQDKPQKVASEKKVVSLDLMSYKLPKKVEETPKPQEKPKPIKKPEPIKKNKPKEVKKEPKPHIPVEPKKEIVEPKVEEVVKEEIVKEEIVPKEIIQPKEVQKPLETKPAINEEMQKQVFIKTNFAIIRDMVLSNLSYPSIAKRMGWTGVAKVELQVDATGKLLHVKIVQSSGKKALDEAALRAAEQLKEKTLPKPQSLTTIALPIAFFLK
jgi:protein TonB